MEKIGLVEKRGIKVTDLGKRLTFGATEDVKNKALKESILNIPLWKQFHTKWGVKLPISDFWVDLGKLTGLEAPEAKKVEEIVRKAYLDDVQYLKPTKKPEKEGLGMEPPDQIDTSTAIPPSMECQANIVKNLIQEEAYDIAKNFIDFIKAKKEEEVASKEEG